MIPAKSLKKGDFFKINPKISKIYRVLDIVMKDRKINVKTWTAQAFQLKATELVFKIDPANITN